MNKAYLLLILFFLFLPPASQSAEVESKKELLQDDLLLTRQKNLLLRIMDDMEKSILYLEEDIENLESRKDSITLLEPESRDRDLSSIKGVYQSHLEWLYKMKDAFHLDYESYFTDSQKRGDWIKRVSIMVKGNEKFKIHAQKSLSHYESKKERLVYFLNRQRFLMTETESLRNEIAALENRKGQIGIDENYLKSLKNKLWAYQVEMNAIASYKEEMYLHYLLLIEELKGNRDWLNMKVEEYRAIENLASELVFGSGEGLKPRYRDLISIFEKEIIALKQKIDLMSAKDWSITPFGEIREVERFEELIDYYKKMKSRYDEYKNLLSVQIDNFRADMEMKGRRE